MLKKIIASLAVSSLFCFTQSSFSQTMTMPVDGGNGGGLFNRIMNHPINIGQTFNKVMTTPITKTTLAEGAEDVAVYEETKSLGLVDLAVAGVATMTIQQIMYHPDNVENFLESYPGMIPSIVNKVSPYPWGAGYLDGIGVGTDAYSKQNDLENTQEWQTALGNIQTMVADVANQEPEKQNCKNPNVARQAWLSLLSAPDIFKTTVTGKLVAPMVINLSNNSSNGSGVNIFDVNSYHELEDMALEGDGLDHDHIPAKATIKVFLESKLKRKLTEIEYEHLIANTVAIVVPHAMHKAGRTWFYKNNRVVINNDATNLQITVLKDLANHFLYVTNNSATLDMNQFIQSSIVLYNRDRIMCLFN